MGSFAPNGYGLYDMAGNVFEWCWDHVDFPLPAYVGGTDPRGALTGARRVLRGGSWGGNAGSARCANRNYGSPANASNYGYGFRAVLSPGQP